uniref:Uncharacterized protein n=1 Tax=Zea mays TaxID=4577 RepID=B4FXL9_MAIZE|nr:unknown [Zea mays]
MESSWLVVSGFPSFSSSCVPRFSLLIAPKTLFSRSVGMPGSVPVGVLRNWDPSIPCCVRRYIEWI